MLCSVEPYSVHLYALFILCKSSLSSSRGAALFTSFGYQTIPWDFSECIDSRLKVHLRDSGTDEVTPVSTRSDSFLHMSVYCKFVVLKVPMRNLPAVWIPMMN